MKTSNSSTIVTIIINTNKQTKSKGTQWKSRVSGLQVPSQWLSRLRRGAIHVQLVVGVEIRVDIPYHKPFPRVMGST